MTGLEYTMFKKHINQSTFARYLNLSRQMIHMWVVGSDDIQQKHHKILEELLQVPINYLLKKQITIQDEIEIDKILLDKKIKSFQDGSYKTKSVQFTTRKRKVNKYVPKFKESSTNNIQDKILKYLINNENEKKRSTEIFDNCNLENNERKMAILILGRLKKSNIIKEHSKNNSKNNNDKHNNTSTGYNINDKLFNELKKYKDSKGLIFRLKNEHKELYGKIVKTIRY